MLLRLAHMPLSKCLNEKGRKTNGGISGEDVMTSYPKEDIIKLS